jgi:hypothetical protein
VTAPRERERRCSTCGDEFLSERAPNGKWRATCSVACRVAAMRRLAETLLDRADKLEAELEDDVA